MAKQRHPIVKLAEEAVEKYVRHGKALKPKELTSEMKPRAGVFVSIKKRGELRGCIGTFMPTRRNIAEEIVANAISSATQDPRFTPVEASELDDLEYSVDVLTEPEPVRSVDQLDPKEYGVIVECGFRRGLLLPNLKGVDSVEEQIGICRAKAGISAEEPIKLYRFRVKRFI
jgi:AmmeMemoRadiSam system protein A